MKRPLSGWEKIFLVVPVAGTLLTWQWRLTQRGFHHVVPATVLPQEFADLNAAHFSPDGRLLLTVNRTYGSPDEAIQRQPYKVAMWDMKTGLALWNERRAWDGGQRYFRPSLFSPDGTRIVAVDKRLDSESLPSHPDSIKFTEQHAVYLYDARSGKTIRKYQTGRVDWATFVDGGRKILCFGYPSQILDARSDKVLVPNCDGRFPNFLASEREQDLPRNTQHVTADGKRALLMGRTYTRAGNTQELQLWDLAAVRKTAGFADPEWTQESTPRNCALSPDGKYACTVAAAEDVVEFWDVAKRTRTQRLKVPGVNTATFSPDSQLLLLRGDLDSAKVPESITGISVYRSGSFRLLWSHTAPPGAKTGDRWFDKVVFSPDSGALVACCDGEIRWINAQSGHVGAKVAGNDMILSPDLKHMVVATAQGPEIQEVPETAEPDK